MSIHLRACVNPLQRLSGECVPEPDGPILGTSTRRQHSMLREKGGRGEGGRGKHSYGMLQCA